YAGLPDVLTLGPRWLLPTVVIILLIPTIVSHQAGHHRLNAIFAYLVDAVLTIGLVISVILLVSALPAKREAPEDLLLSAAALWITNILVFALWYWRLDAGGPHERDMRARHTAGAFLFPQMTLNDEMLKNMEQQDWSPNFVDYLFLAFNTSTAF